MAELTDREKEIKELAYDILAYSIIRYYESPWRAVTAVNVLRKVASPNLPVHFP